MSLRTRLDGRSQNNSSLEIVDENGVVLATVVACSSKVELAIDTAEGIYIKKNNKTIGAVNG